MSLPFTLDPTIVKEMVEKTELAKAALDKAVEANKLLNRIFSQINYSLEKVEEIEKTLAISSKLFAKLRNILDSEISCWITDEVLFKLQKEYTYFNYISNRILTEICDSVKQQVTIDKINIKITQALNSNHLSMFEVTKLLTLVKMTQPFLDGCVFELMDSKIASSNVHPVKMDMVNKLNECLLNRHTLSDKLVGILSKGE
jgi:hypothetical protein